MKKLILMLLLVTTTAAFSQDSDSFVKRYTREMAFINDKVVSDDNIDAIVIFNYRGSADIVVNPQSANARYAVVGWEEKYTKLNGHYQQTIAYAKDGTEMLIILYDNDTLRFFFMEGKETGCIDYIP